jgi:diacylglycerol kinase
MSYLAARLRSVAYAAAGVGHLLRTQPNARLHLLATAAVVAAGARLRLPPADWCWLFAAIGAVWMAEAFNTAVELLADAAVPHHHPLVGRAKDVAAAAVLVTAVTAAAIGTVVFLPRVVPPAPPTAAPPVSMPAPPDAALTALPNRRTANVERRTAPLPPLRHCPGTCSSVIPSAPCSGISASPAAFSPATASGVMASS